jgi:CheY-like chemotaxis protein
MTTVLLVDDEPETLAGWEMCCEQSGYDVKAAGDGQVALAVLMGSPVDVVVADWHMPKMSGSALCHHIRNAPRLAGTIFIHPDVGRRKSTRLCAVRRLSAQARRRTRAAGNHAALTYGARGRRCRHAGSRFAASTTLRRARLSQPNRRDYFCTNPERRPFEGWATHRGQGEFSTYMCLACPYCLDCHENPL